MFTLRKDINYASEPAGERSVKMRTYLSLRAFTLVELLVVIAIVGLLSTIVLAVTSGLGSQASLTKTLAWARSISSLLGPEAVGIWNFDEGVMDTCPTDKDACDISGWNNHGTAYGNVAYSVDTPSGQGYALSFDGDGDCIDCGNDSSLNLTDAITVEAWIKTADITQMIVMKHSGYKEAFRLMIETDGRVAAIGSADGSNWEWMVYGPVVNDNIWHHTILTHDKNIGMKLFIDGVLKGYDSTLGTLKSAPSDNIRIANGAGYGTPPDTYYFNGLIDDVRIYATVLTTFQIQSRYYAGLNKLLTKGLISGKEYQNRLVLN